MPLHEGLGPGIDIVICRAPLKNVPQKSNQLLSKLYVTTNPHYALDFFPLFQKTKIISLQKSSEESTEAKNGTRRKLDRVGGRGRGRASRALGRRRTVVAGGGGLVGRTRGAR